VPTVRIIYDVEGWAFHRRALALQRYAPSDFDISVAALPRLDQVDAALGDDEPDIVFVISHPELRTVRRVLTARGWRSKLVGSWNCGWPLRIAEFYPTYRDADALVINNSLTWERLGQLPNTYPLSNGVDCDLFRVHAPIEARQPKVLWTGSQLGRQRKGYDRFLLPLQEALHRRGIACDLLLVDSYSAAKRTAAEMVEWYNTGTVFVSASSTEGTPNTALEAAACGCTVVSTATGNMPELIRHGVNGYLVERDAEALLAGVRTAIANYHRAAGEMQRDIRAWDWQVRSAGFYEMFRAVLEPGPRNARAASAPRPDLSDQVTVFVTTVGAPSYDACQAHLRAQDCAFRLHVIDRIAPMSRAFQRMLDDCQTPFFVQVDEDMLLYPHAIRTLHELINRSDDTAAMAIADLYDAHLERCILGVKIYRHAIVRRYPFANVQSFEKLHLQQLRADGHQIVWTPPGKLPTKEHTLGLHGTHWTTDSIYERYATLERRRRGHPRELAWFAEYAGVLLRRYLDEPSELNFFALFGLLSGTLAADGAAADKDFRTYDSLPGLREARQLFAQLQHGGAAQLHKA
jgi:glycosyltransferase involved in cell wall biosynthesis